MEQAAVTEVHGGVVPGNLEKVEHRAPFVDENVLERIVRYVGEPPRHSAERVTGEPERSKRTRAAVHARRIDVAEQIFTHVDFNQPSETRQVVRQRRDLVAFDVEGLEDRAALGDGWDLVDFVPGREQVLHGFRQVRQRSQRVIADV